MNGHEFLLIEPGSIPKAEAAKRSNLLGKLPWHDSKCPGTGAWRGKLSAWATDSWFSPSQGWRCVCEAVAHCRLAVARDGSGQAACISSCRRPRQPRFTRRRVALHLLPGISKRLLPRRGKGERGLIDPPFHFTQVPHATTTLYHRSLQVT